LYRVEAGAEASKPAKQSDSTPSETAWVDQAWDPSQIITYPRPLLTPVDEFLALDPKNNNDTKVPREFKSQEGWSVASRKHKTLTGYYASWRYYANQERTKPMNMKFQKVDRVNYAFFQTNPDGDIWGTDPWADPLNLFGPVDWMKTIQPEIAYAPQFNDDNGFDDSSGDNFNYVGSKYVELGEGVMCHRSSPKGKRDCKAYLLSQGLIGRAQSQGAQVYISIGGWSLSDNFPKVAANAVTRRNFAKNCVGLVREYGIDGIDVDWEFPG
jgi:GH18 family chitinase